MIGFSIMMWFSSALLIFLVLRMYDMYSSGGSNSSFKKIIFF